MSFLCLSLRNGLLTRVTEERLYVYTYIWVLVIMSVIIEFFLTCEAVADIVVSMKSDSICTYHFSRPRSIDYW